MLTILLVEDNWADAFLTREALLGLEEEHELFTVEDGPSALAFLNAEAPYQHVPRPDVVLLDLNLPGMSGPEVLARARRQERLAGVVFIALLATAGETGWWQERGLQADAFLPKPVDALGVRDAWLAHRRAS